MQGGVSEVDDAGAVRGRDVGVAQVPFVGHDPVEHPRAARDLGPRDRDLLLEDVEGGSHPVAGQAAAEGEEPPHQLVGLVSDVRGTGFGTSFGCDHGAHASTALRQKKASAWALGELHSMPRSRSRPENRSSRNQRFDRCEAKWSIRWSILRRESRLGEWHERVRGAHVPVVLRHLVLEDQVVAEGVPGQLAADPVILVQVPALVSEDHVG